MLDRGPIVGLKKPAQPSKQEFAEQRVKAVLLPGTSVARDRKKYVSLRQFGKHRRASMRRCHE